MFISVKNDIDLSTRFEWFEAITQVQNLDVGFNFMMKGFSLCQRDVTDGCRGIQLYVEMPVIGIHDWEDLHCYWLYGL